MVQHLSSGRAEELAMKQACALTRRVLVSVVAGVLTAFGVATALAQTPEQRANTEDAVASTSTVSAADATASHDRPARRARDRRRDHRAAEETASSASVAAPAAAALQASAEPALVCQSVKVIGSRIERKICGTPEEWAASKESSAKGADEFMRQMREIASIAPSQGAGPQQSATPASLK
jgi:hypothetical protein